MDAPAVDTGSSFRGLPDGIGSFHGQWLKSMGFSTGFSRPMRTDRRYAAILALGLSLAALTACGKGDDKAAGGQPPATVTTTRLQPVRWSDELTALGTAKA